MNDDAEVDETILSVLGVGDCPTADEPPSTNLTASLPGVLTAATYHKSAELTNGDGSDHCDSFLSLRRQERGVWRQNIVPPLTCPPQIYDLPATK